MNLVAYLRVSTDHQAERGFGLDVQEQAVTAWASNAGHEITAWTRDEGISGAKDAAERPGLTEALSMLREGEAGGLLVARIDRLARTLTVQEAVLAQVWRYGGRVFSADVGEIHTDDPDDPMRTFVRQVMGAAAQLDRATIVARLRAGRRVKGERGGFAYGAPPFGTKTEGGTLVKIAEQQTVLERITELRGKGVTLREIGETLTAEGHRPPRGGDQWHPATLLRIIRREEGQPSRRWLKTAN